MTTIVVRAVTRAGLAAVIAASFIGCDDSGAVVSAASTAILRNGWLYMGQVFDPQVVGCPLP